MFFVIVFFIISFRRNIDTFCEHESVLCNYEVCFSNGIYYYLFLSILFILYYS